MGYWQISTHKLMKNNHLPAALSSLIFGSLLLSAHSQELAPDDATISPNLGIWLRDAGNTFDPDTGIWNDSSGNNFDAEPVGEVNVVSSVTFSGPTLGSVSGGAFQEGEVASVRFANDLDDLSRSTGINGGAGLSELTIFVVYNIDLLAASASSTRIAGFGSINATQANAGNHFNLAGDPSIRRDNGQVGAGMYSEGVPTTTTFIRTARMSATGIDEWFNSNGTLTNVLSVTGSSFTTSTDDFFIGDLRGGFTTTPSFGDRARADFDIIQAIVYTSALTDEEVAGVNEWLGNNLATATPSSTPLVITDINFDGTAGSATITWSASNGTSYAVDASNDLMIWQELDDGIVAVGETASFTEEGLENEPKRFYRVREL